MKIRIIIILTFWSFTSCQKNVQNPKYIDIANSINIIKKIQLNSFADSLRTIPLKEEEQFHLPGNSYIIAVSSAYAFVKGQGYIYRYNMKGHFINRIGHVGKGPTEYLNISSVDIDTVHKYVVILSLNNKIYFYNYKNTFIRTINPTNDIICQMKVIDNKRIVCEVRNYKSGLKAYLSVYSFKGELIKKIPLESDDANHKIDRSINSIMYHSGSVIKIKTPYNDTIYELNNLQLKVHKILGLGKLSPTRLILENMDYKRILYSDYVQIVDIRESFYHLFLLSIYKQKLLSTIIDKRNNKIIYNYNSGDPRKGGGISNDFNNTKFWPQLTIPNKQLVSLGMNFENPKMNQESFFIYFWKEKENHHDLN